VAAPLVLPAVPAGRGVAPFVASAAGAAAPFAASELRWLSAAPCADGPAPAAAEAFRAPAAAERRVVAAVVGSVWVQDAAVMHLKMILEATGKKGVPQGGVVSPLLSNIYLTEVDRMLEKAIATTHRGKYTHVQYGRFADGTPVQMSNLWGASPLIPIVRSGI
jgi:hypothetical protein